jgi:signal peptidase I
MNRTKAIVLFLVVIGVIAATALLIITYDFQLIAYKGKDMEPTISQNQNIVISKRIGSIQRGDIVIFKYPSDPSQLFVKRVVGLPGEIIAIQDGRVFVDQKPLEESYLDKNLPNAGRSIPEYQIPTRSYYVLGDNRNASNDSRNWGPLSVDLIYGRVIFR